MQSLSEAEIEAIVKRVGPPRANHAKKPVDIEKVRAMRTAGFSKPQIAEYFDVSAKTISRRFRHEVREAEEAERAANRAERAANRAARYTAASR